MFTEDEMYKAAAMLKSADGENPEYDRALAELIWTLAGGDLEDVERKLK